MPSKDEKNASSLLLSGIDPGDTGGLDESQCKQELEKLQSKMEDLQARLYASKARALLIILQGLDTSGKDGTIRRVMSGVSPLGCTVTGFKAPTEEERDHDFLWRIHHRVPRQGFIGIFNRSHYEDVTVVRVHGLAPKEVWEKRFEQINDFERLLVQSGTKVLKFFLHISNEEQRRRLQERLTNPKKNWKLSAEDIRDRPLWGEYIKAYEEVFRRCSSEHAPWIVVPSNKKWYRDVVVARAIIDALASMNLKYPKPSLDLDGLTIP